MSLSEKQYWAELPLQNPTKWVELNVSLTSLVRKIC